MDGINYNTLAAIDDSAFVKLDTDSVKCWADMPLIGENQAYFYTVTAHDLYLELQVNLGLKGVQEGETCPFEITPDEETVYEGRIGKVNGRPLLTDAFACSLKMRHKLNGFYAVDLP